MSKNKYTPNSGTNFEGGERKQRDYTKTGKLAKRREVRRLEAIARQIRRIQEVEKALKGGKVNETITKYISTFKEPALALVHANRVLKMVRGGVPHSQLVHEEKAAVVLPTPQPAVNDKKKVKKDDKKSKSKYQQKKQKKTAKEEKQQNVP